MRALKRALAWLGVLVFLALTTAGAWLPPVIGHAVEKDYRFPEVRIDATVRPNGDLVLEERRTFEFRNGPFTFAYFNVDDPLDHLRDFSIAEVRQDGGEVPVEPDYASHSIATNGFQAQWSYEAEDETRTWVFRYRVACAVNVYQDTAHLYWQFIGTGWEKVTDHAVVTIHLPDAVQMLATPPYTCEPDGPRSAPLTGGTPLERGQVRAFGHGPLNGEVTFVDPSTIRLKARDVPPRSILEGSILFPPSVVPYGAQQPGSQLDAILAQERVWAEEANALRSRHDAERRWVGYLLLLVPVVCALFVVLAKLRDRVPDVPEVLEQPPEDDAVVAALLWSAWRGHLSPQNAYRAQILRLADLGAIELRAEGRVTDPKDLTIVRRMDALDLPTEADQDFLWLLFGRGERAVDEVSLSRPRPRPGGASFSSKWLEASKGKARDLLVRIRKGDARIESTGSFVVAFGAALYGVWTAAWGVGGAVGWWLVPTSLVSLVVSLRIIPARLGLEDRTRVMRLAAFRHYLKDFSDLPNAPALAVVIWDEYLTWAVALDVAEEVEKQVKAFVPVESLRAPLPGGPSGLAGLNAWNSFQAAAPSIVLHSMASASASSGSSSGGFGSSSSSSGFSSGGFSGGGGGGGGGTGGGAG